MCVVCRMDEELRERVREDRVEGRMWERMRMKVTAGDGKKKN